MLLNTLQFTGWPPQQTYSAPSVSEAGVEKRALGLFLHPGQHLEAPTELGRQAAGLEKPVCPLRGENSWTQKPVTVTTL